MSSNTGGDVQGTDVWRHLQNLLTASKRPHISLCSCRCSLPFPVSPQTPWCQLHQPKTLSQLEHHHGPLLRLRLSFLSFFKGALLPNFNKMVERDLSIMWVQQLKDIFSIVLKNLGAWLMLGLQANAVIAERCKSRRRKSGDDSTMRMIKCRRIWRRGRYKYSIYMTGADRSGRAV